MKKILIPLVVVFLLLLSMSVHAGQPLGSPHHWIAPPNSMAFGNSLDDWMVAWLRWFEDGADPDARMRNVAFLPIVPGPEFDVEVEVGTALILPVATWLGTESDYSDILPDNWFGDPAHIFGEISLNGGPVVEINEDYYVGPTDLVPPVFGIVYYYQALACVILPLPPGVHVIELHSEFVDFGAVFDNTWTITVVPRKK